MSAVALNYPSQSLGISSIAVSTSGITRRGRLARSLVVLSLAIVLGAAFSMKAGAGAVVTHTDHASYVSVVVAPGETLWSIASDAVKVSGSSDVLSMVDAIMSANALAVPDVAAGQVLRVPA